MRAGMLNKRVIIQQKSVTQDSYGAEVVSWTTFSTVCAAVGPLSGREFFASRQINADISTRVLIRYLSGVIPSMRISYGSKVYDILSVIDPDEKHAEMQLMCKEVL